MRVSAPAVVAGWGALNAALAATLAGFGEQGAAIALYGSVSALVMIIALVTRGGARRRQGRRTWRAVPAGDSVLVLAAGILVAALGLAFNWYLGLLGVPLFALAALREHSARREGT